MFPKIISEQRETQIRIEINSAIFSNVEQLLIQINSAKYQLIGGFKYVKNKFRKN